MNRVFNSIAIIGMVTFSSSGLFARQSGPNWSQKMLHKSFAGWDPVTQVMLSGSPYNEYPGASGELTLSDGSQVTLICRKAKERIEYQVVRADKSGRVTSLFRDSWPSGNPIPYIAINHESSLKDIKTKKEWIVNPAMSFVVDEWAYRWIIAKVNGKWSKILVQSEE